MKPIGYILHENRINKNPKGKLYAKYYNSVRNMKNTGLIPIPITKNKTMNEKKQKNNWFEKQFGIPNVNMYYLSINCFFIMILTIYII